MPAGIAAVGREVAVTWKGVGVKGLKEKKVKHNDTPIDITTGEDDGVQLMLATSGQDSIEITLSGLTKDTVIKEDWFEGGAARQGAVEITYPDGSTLTGTFQLSNFQEGAPLKDAITFEVTLLSSGAFVFTPAA